ncbi:hypothetical protein OF83DRAFT_1259018 [Amylostereum chailletii]|nr:hypothetical protein OF83DRAFT_1259018 [Amylostereum chailletii]
MDLRRFAQSNAMSSPRKAASSSASSSGPSTPVSKATVPVTPRTRPSYAISRSPLLSPSISASLPFDWDSARQRRDPPYSPLGSKRKAGRKSEMGVGTNGTPAKRVVRKKGMYEKLTAIPSRIAFEISIFPQNVPLPAPKTSAWLLGGSLHLLHFLVRLSQVRSIPDSNTGWEDMYHEDNNASWLDWTVLLTFLLLSATSVNTLFLFTHTKIYHLHSQPDPVASPHARFVAKPADPPTLGTRVRAYMWRAFVGFWRFLFGLTSSSTSGASADSSRRIQELEVWTPGEMELMLFCVYSPMHALLWMLWNASNWIMIMFVMLGMGIQLNVLVQTYDALLKDRSIIAAEVMHEYDTKGRWFLLSFAHFVYPRVNPVRRDACVMTHESEMVGH